MKPSEERYIDEQNAKAVERARRIQFVREYLEARGHGWIVLTDQQLLRLYEAI